MWLPAAIYNEAGYNETGLKRTGWRERSSRTAPPFFVGWSTAAWLLTLVPPCWSVSNLVWPIRTASMAQAELDPTAAIMTIKVLLNSRETLGGAP